MRQWWIVGLAAVFGGACTGKSDEEAPPGAVMEPPEMVALEAIESIGPAPHTTWLRAVNEWGVHLMDRGTKEHLLTIDYYDIKKWSCSSVQLTLCVGEAETRLVCRMPSGKPKEATNVMKVYVSIQASKPLDGGGGGELL